MTRLLILLLFSGCSTLSFLNREIKHANEDVKQVIRETKELKANIEDFKETAKGPLRPEGRPEALKKNKKKGKDCIPVIPFMGCLDE